jgi:hypothetical protein
MPKAHDGDSPFFRWYAIVYYRTDSGTLTCEHDLEEIADLHDLIELGRHWDTIENVELLRVNHITDEKLGRGGAWAVRDYAVLTAPVFDAFVERQCAKEYAPCRGRPSLPPGRYFRMLMGYFEDIEAVFRSHIGKDMLVFRRILVNDRSWRNEYAGHSGDWRRAPLVLSGAEPDEARRGWRYSFRQSALRCDPGFLRRGAATDIESSFPFSPRRPKIERTQGAAHMQRLRDGSQKRV